MTRHRVAVLYMGYSLLLLLLWRFREERADR